MTITTILLPNLVSTPQIDSLQQLVSIYGGKIDHFEHQIKQNLIELILWLYINTLDRV